MYQKYAQLLTQYCLEVQRGDKVMIRSTYLSERLIVELAREIALQGGVPVLNIEIQDFDNAWMAESDMSQLEWVNPMNNYWNETFNGYIYIRAPYDSKDRVEVPIEKRNAYNAAQAPIRQTYMRRTGTRDLKRNLCQYPTPYSAREASMTLEEYEKFVFQACNLFEENPLQAWRDFGKNQQRIVDYLNTKTQFRYVGANCDLTFKTQGRIWINSDGKTNMPSGEVYTAPVDDSMNGWIRYSYPSLYMGETVENISLEFKDGYITQWDASSNKDFLDKIMGMDGARRVGEAAIGTNMNIQQSTRNILFDEKIGGTIHIAIGDAYKQCNGVNESAVHWDMITDMKEGEIYADGELCYQNGKFII